MVLVLGKHECVIEYVKNNLGLTESDILCCPSSTTHHSEFVKHIDEIKNSDFRVVTTQSIEMIDVLLASDLEFDVIRTRQFEDGVRIAKMSKEEVRGCRNAWNFDPRD